MIFEKCTYVSFLIRENKLNANLSRNFYFIIMVYF